MKSIKVALCSKGKPTCHLHGGYKKYFTEELNYLVAGGDAKADGDGSSVYVLTPWETVFLNSWIILTEK